MFVHSVDTKSEIVKILPFRQFYNRYVFNEEALNKNSTISKMEIV